MDSQVATDVTIWTISPLSPWIAPWMASFTSMSACRAGASSAAWDKEKRRDEIGDKKGENTINVQYFYWMFTRQGGLRTSLKPVLSSLKSGVYQRVISDDLGGSREYSNCLFFPVRQSILLCNCSCCVALIKTTKIRSQKQFYVTERCSWSSAAVTLVFKHKHLDHN